MCSSQRKFPARSGWWKTQVASRYQAVACRVCLLLSCERDTAAVRALSRFPAKIQWRFRGGGPSWELHQSDYGIIARDAKLSRALT